VRSLKFSHKARLLMLPSFCSHHQISTMADWDAYDAALRHVHASSSRLPTMMANQTAGVTTHTWAQPQWQATNKAHGINLTSFQAPALRKQQLPHQRPTLSLEHYIDLLNILCGYMVDNLPVNGQQRSWMVRPASNLVTRSVRVDELKQVLALNGAPTRASKTKENLLQRMEGMQLAAPVCVMDENTADNASQGGPSSGASESQSRQLLFDGLRHALSWAAPAHTAQIAEAAASQGYYSHCELGPSTTQALYCATEDPRHRVHKGDINVAASCGNGFISPSAEARIGNPPSKMPATSNGLTTASRPPRPLTSLQDSQEVEMPLYNAMQIGSTRDWLAKQVEKLSLTTQASVIAPEGFQTGLIGRKVGVVLLTDFTVVDDSDGKGDTLARGLHVGQVVEWIGNHHDADGCPDDCSESHNYCYVRFKSTCPSLAGQARRRLDVAVDLRPEFCFSSLVDFIMASEDQLVDAWVLLEPREDASFSSGVISNQDTTS
jgi:hypothetical protein